mmetsp:Transcript_42973/g.108507  ORF Transcript_42973/g.108507 Transcript_42973/m.108507 type:complete len:392 (+) Transcript_42973:97-1272(+)
MFADPEFLDAFLHTHTYFMKSSELIENLIARFRSSKTRVWHEQVRLPVLKVFRRWFEEFGHHLEGTAYTFIDTLCDFVNEETAVYPSEEGQLTYMKLCVLRLRESLKKKDQLVRNLSSFFSGTGNEVSDWKEIDPLVIAQQLTLIDQGLFRAIPGHEFIHQRFNDPSKSTNYQRMVAHFNLLGRWVGGEVLASETVSERVNTIVPLVSIAEHCRQLKSFNTCFAICCGLNLSSVARLHATWESVPRKTRHLFKSLDCELFAVSHNFAHYRQAYQLASPPKVPWIALYTKDLVGVEVNNPTFDKERPSLVAFAKMRLLWQVFRDVRFTQQVIYPIQRAPDVYALLRSIIADAKSESELYERSLEVEQRECTAPVAVGRPACAQPSTPKSGRT